MTIRLKLQLGWLKLVVNSHCAGQVLTLAALACFLHGCASPTDQLIDIANTQKFQRADIKANGFKHFVMRNSVQPDTDKTLHVYLEGDGSPWKYRVLRMRDPTPRSPLMLKLMALDETAAAYLGRPCYNGSFDDTGCSDDLWTSARYSETVVSSMVSALNKLIRRLGARNVRLFGHSGGGTLAMLIAERVPAVTHVVTLAGNLDTDAWVKHHRYTPLYGSLNPAKRQPLRESVAQWHFMGRKDGVVPPPIVQAYVRAQTNAFGAIIGTFSHGCCWQRLWPSVLIGIKSNNTAQLPGMRVKLPPNQL